ncbi:MAG: spore cortex biosynthesis protein YabQ [Bacillota bacterium]
MGLLFDISTFLRRLMGSGRLATACTDLSFWLFSAAMTFAMLMQANRGEVRVFVIAGIAGGFWVYSLTIKHGVFPILLWCESAIRKTGHWARRSCRWGRRAAGGMSRAVQKGFLKMRRTLPQSLSPKSRSGQGRQDG